jgi:hypothetical protein
MKHIVFGVCLLTALVSCRTTEEAGSEVKFYGADNQSADMRYSSYIEVALPQGVTSNDAVMQDPVKLDMQNIIVYQVQHMFGAFTEHPGFKRNPGIIKAKGIPVITSAEVNTKKGTVKVFYNYEDKVVFKQRLMKYGPTKIEFVLPKDPSTIYAKGFTKNGTVNKCTDEHYNSEGDFWYFWNPKKAGCPIKTDDLVKITADILPIANTTLTYPYYNEILGDNGNGKKFRIVYLVGVDEGFKAGDLGRQTYNEAIDLLQKAGYTLPPNSPARKKVLTYNTPDYEVELEISLVNPDSAAFVQAAAEGLESADIFIYDGHSGLGGYLNIERFQTELGRPLNLPVNKNQILYFNGCSTFSYYNGDYFDLKKTTTDLEGRTKLDILTTSIGATFDIGARHDIELITSITLGKRPSWQTILDNIYRVDRSQSALTHVNGDEDNPSVPQ